MTQFLAPITDTLSTGFEIKDSYSGRIPDGLLKGNGFDSVRSPDFAVNDIQ